MTLHITEMPYPQTLYRRGFSDWRIKCRQKVVEADEVSTPRSVLDNLGLSEADLGFSEAACVVINGSLLVKRMLDTPLRDILNGLDGFLTIVREEMK